MPFKMRNSHPRADDVPDYDQAVSNSGRTSLGDVHSPLLLNDPFISSNDPFAGSVDEGRTVYTYHLAANSVHLEILIAVEPVDRHSGRHTFSLSIKAGGVERTISKPIVMNLFLQPHQLEFSAFIFPPKVSLPADCLYRLRVWLRASQVDHRLFAEDELWIGSNPDFRTIPGVSIAHFTSAAPFMLVYQGFVGKAQVAFIIRWRHLGQNNYTVSLEYEAGGAGRMLFDDCRIRLGPECDPQCITFIIYAVPIKSTPPNASHRLRLWIRTPATSGPSPTSSVRSLGTQSFIYQRIWKSDDFKLGAQLYFGALSSKVVMGVPDARGPQFERRVQILSVSTTQSVFESGVPEEQAHIDDRDETL